MLLIAPPPAHSSFPEGHSAGHRTKAAQKANTSLLLRPSETMEREKKAIQHLCLLRFKHVAFSVSLPSFLLIPQRLLCRAKHVTVSELSLSSFLATHKKISHNILAWFWAIVERLVKLLADEPWRGLNGQACPLTEAPVWYGRKVGRLVPHSDC